MKQQTARKNTRKSRTEITPSRIGLAAGAGALGLSTGFMNVSGWVAQGQDTTQKILNGVMSGGMELLAASAFAWAGWQLSKGRWSRATAAGVAGAAVVYFNTLATQNFLELQAHEAQQAIEEAAQTLALSESEIARLQMEVDSLIVQNGGTVPRPVDVIEAAYSRFDPDANPINMSRKAAEIGARREYDRLQTEMRALRQAAADDAIIADDQTRSVIPREQLPAFIWALQILQGTAFFLLGTNDLTTRLKRKRPTTRSALVKKAGLSPEADAGQTRALPTTSDAPSPVDQIAALDADASTGASAFDDAEAHARANRQKWAIIRGKQRSGSPTPSGG